MIIRVDRTVQTAQGQAVSGAQFYVLTQPADVDTLTPLATVYSSTGGAPADNPQITDGLGQVGFYLDNSQLYTFVVVSPLIETQSYPDQSPGNSPSGSSPFEQTPAGTIDGTNVTFTLTVSPSLLFLQYNSGVLIPNVGYTTAVVDGVFTITLAVAPQVGDSLYASGLL
jgi:hypothetical protein